MKSQGPEAIPQREAVSRAGEMCSALPSCVFLGPCSSSLSLKFLICKTGHWGGSSKGRNIQGLACRRCSANDCGYLWLFSQLKFPERQSSASVQMRRKGWDWQTMRVPQTQYAGIWGLGPPLEEEVRMWDRLSLLIVLCPMKGPPLNGRGSFRMEASLFQRWGKYGPGCEGICLWSPSWMIPGLELESRPDKSQISLFCCSHRHQRWTAQR